MTLVHTGRLSGVGGSRGGDTLLDALRRVREERGLPRIRLVHAGPFTVEERALVACSGTSAAFEYAGILDREEVLELQRSADALVLLTSAKTSEATGKLFEYLAAGRPIVALADGNEAARIVRETGAGVAVPPRDVDAITAALRGVATGELAAGYKPRELETYLYPAPALAMAQAVEAAIAARARTAAGLL